MAVPSLVVRGGGWKCYRSAAAGASLPSVQAAAAIARALKISLDELARLSSNADPEPSRLIYPLEELNEQDRALARRFLGLLLGE